MQAVFAIFGNWDKVHFAGLVQFYTGAETALISRLPGNNCQG